MKLAQSLCRLFLYKFGKRVVTVVGMLKIELITPVHSFDIIYKLVNHFYVVSYCALFFLGMRGWGG